MALVMLFIFLTLFFAVSTCGLFVVYHSSHDLTSDAYQVIPIQLSNSNVSKMQPPSSVIWSITGKVMHVRVALPLRVGQDQKNGLAFLGLPLPLPPVEASPRFLFGSGTARTSSAKCFVKPSDEGKAEAMLCFTGLGEVENELFDISLSCYVK